LHIFRLKVLGLKSLDELDQKIVPKKIRGNGEELSNLPAEALSEADALKEITEISKMNKVLTSFIGMGYVSRFPIIVSKIKATVLELTIF
jgi:glycine cleavage system pyridoxal-binding protein P